MEGPCNRAAQWPGSGRGLATTTESTQLHVTIRVIFLPLLSRNYDGQFDFKFSQVCYLMHMLRYTKLGDWSLTITNSVFKLHYTAAFCRYNLRDQPTTITGCRGRADKSTELELCCFCSAECGFESRSSHLCPWVKTLNYNFSSPPRGKWVPVRPEMVLVRELALSALHIWRHRLYTPQGAEII